ncbi:MAG: ribonuclease PH [Thermaerobacter sp.]|nr:ribonuclease PH [Thermaerobacter sp.]
MRPDGRAPEEMRPVRLQRGFLPKAEGSCLVEIGRTRVVCTVTVEEKVPGWRRGQGGWLTAEYAMLPRATEDRTPREVSRGRPAGRSQEIQRLIGRSLRAAVDLAAIGDRTLWVDCDVLEADGGTRTASITGAAVALCDALAWLTDRDGSVKRPLSHLVAAVSCGIVGGNPVLDLCYAEDSQAAVDANFVLTDAGEFVEVQATGEGGTLKPAQLEELLGLAQHGTAELFLLQRAALGEQIGKVMRRA